MLKVPNGQDPYSVIGQYIRNHVSAIEDMIAVIEIDGRVSNQLFMVDMTVDGYFIWENDWYEGEKNVVLIDFFPVSDACNSKDHWIPCSERLPKKDEQVFVYLFNDLPHIAWVCEGRWYTEEFILNEDEEPVAWMPLPEPYQ